MRENRVFLNLANEPTDAPLHQIRDADPTLFLTHPNGSVELEVFRFYVEIQASEGI